MPKERGQSAEGMERDNKVVEQEVLYRRLLKRLDEAAHLVPVEPINESHSADPFEEAVGEIISEKFRRMGFEL